MNKAKYFLGDDAGTVGQGHLEDVLTEVFQTGIVGYGLHGQGDEFFLSLAVLDVEGSVAVCQSEGVLRLMVFGHVRAGHENDGLADKAELRDAAGSGTTDHEVGGTIGSGHVCDEGLRFEV